MSLRDELIQVAAVAVAIVQDLDNGSTREWQPTWDEQIQHLTEPVLKEVKRERRRQEAKWGPQHHTPEEWLAILAEEVGEAASEAHSGDVRHADFAPLFQMFIRLAEAERYARIFLKERFDPDPQPRQDDVRIGER